MRRPRAKILRLAAVTAASAAVTAACGGTHVGTTSGLAAGPSGAPVTVGISEPLSGPLQAQGFAADGQACLQGYELWASDVNSHGGLLGHPVKLIVMNDKGWPASTQYDYNWLIKHDHVDLTLAPFSSLLTAAGAIPATKPLRYVLAAGQAGAPSVYAQNDPYLFSTNVPVADQIQPFAKWVAHQLPLAQRPKTAAYPMVNNPFAWPPVEAAQTILQGAGIKTVYINPGTPPNIGYTNLNPGPLKADARAVARKNPGIVVLGSVDVPTVSAFINEFIALKWHPKMMIAAAGPDQGTAFLSAIGTPGNSYGIMVPNGWFGGLPNSLSHVMVQDYIAKYGGTASTINADVAESYSAGEIIAAAVRATGVTASGGTNQQKIASWLHVHSVQTVLGTVAFNGQGMNTDAGNAALIFQWQQGAGGTGAKFVQVLPLRRQGDSGILQYLPGWAS
jgi:branched-chain amino acid transport system substrate-binding protein